MLPSFFIDEEIKVDEWKNIPIPVVEATKTFKKAMHNFERLFLELCKQSKTRSENVASKFKTQYSYTLDLFEKQKKVMDFKLKAQD